MLETAPAYDSLQISQGDVFRWKTTTHSCDEGIIVTADCDIAQGKFGTHLTYVPVIPLNVYLHRFFLPGKLMKVREQVLMDISSSVWRLQQSKRSEFSTRMSDAVVDTWVRSTPTADVLSDLQADGRDRSRLEKAIADYLMICGILDSESDRPDAIPSMIATEKTTEAKIHREIHDHVKRLPGDRMYISSLDGKTEAGYVILLRYLREIRKEDLAISPAQTSSAEARRIARLQSPYRYRLTQLLGEVFSSIGLPTPYETGRDEVLASSYSITGQAKS